VVPYKYIRELVGFQKGTLKQVDVHGGTLEGFCIMITGKLMNKEIVFGTPSSKCFTHGCARGFWGE
jgi:hypothetical protein